MGIGGDLKEVHETRKILDDRGKNYGSYESNAERIQALKNIIHNSPGWEKAPAYMRESLDMICNKLGRIINGNPYYDDSWKDICGYSQLVVDILKQIQ
jgi:hypothetical protein